MEKDQGTALLRVALDNPAVSFRQGQWEAIHAAAVLRRKCLVIQRTGWGKSIVYFLATRILRDQGAGPTLVVSPLLALMRNQIEAARRLGLTAETINSTNADDWREIEDRIVAAEIDVLLISPERLANETFLERVLSQIADRLGLLVIDEAHCISDWGHDFRPDYQRLSNVLRRLPENAPVICTTATANNRVIDDICSQLGDLEVQRGGLMRRSLELQTLRLPDQAARLAWLSDHIHELPGTGIIYTLTRRDADQVAGWLRSEGVQAEAYYSDVAGGEEGDSSSWREELESRLYSNQLKALVATSALGMGYDKPDLGFVVHYQTPGSIIAYYQQVGRAGRAIDRAVGVLMAGAEDAQIQEFFRRRAFPRERDVEAILGVLEKSDGLSLRDLEQALNFRNGVFEQALKFLAVQNPSPIVKDGGRWLRTPVNWQMDHERIARLTRQREAEWQELRDYIAHTGCMMEFLARRLDDPEPQACGKCAGCRGEPLIGEQVQRETAVRAARFLRHSEFPLEPKKQVAKGAFEIYAWRGNIPPRLCAEPGRVLARWGNAGWGCLVAQDKSAGRFRGELVEACAEMFQERWRPDPYPQGVTCIPSFRHPELVPDFAARLAERLGLPFLDLIEKIRDNEPQKSQQNRFHHCRNLDGVFGIRGELPAIPLLLVDDVYDSGWTLTVASRLLRQHGSGPVFPLALASAGIGN